MNHNLLEDINLLSNKYLENLMCSENDMINNNDMKEHKICKNCNSLNFREEYAKGMIFCYDCGQVSDNIVDTRIEHRNYDNTTHTASGSISHNKFLPVSSLGLPVNLKGKFLKLHIWNSMPYKERSNNVMFKKIHNVCAKYNIYRKIEDDAKILCKQVSETLHTTGKNKGKPIITRGFNREGIVASCLFIACRRNNETHATKEIAYYFNIDERDVNKGYRSLLEIMGDNEMVKDIGTSRVVHFIKRKCDELEIKNRYMTVAHTIANNIDRLNIASNHTTFSLAAASILLMANIFKLKHISKKRLSHAFYNLSDVTIGKTYNQIKKYKDVLTDNRKVDVILIDINNRKQKRSIPKEVWVQMKRFNIDTSNYLLEQ
jgi:transcription initiation factor TFIIB